MSKQYSLPLPYREAMGADDFMVGNNNAEAVAWLDKWPDWPTPCLIIYGPAGSGKTHLARVWQTKSRGREIPVNELKKQDAANLAAHHKAIVIDNIDEISGDGFSEETLFHLYNYLKESKGFLLLTASKPVAHWAIKLPDLRSRLFASLAVAIAAPDDALLASLLIKQFRDRQIDIGMDVIDYLLPRITRTPASIREAVKVLDQTSLSEGRAITVALARRLLEDGRFLISQ